MNINASTPRLIIITITPSPVVLIHVITQEFASKFANHSSFTKEWHTRLYSIILTIMLKRQFFFFLNGGSVNNRDKFF